MLKFSTKYLQINFKNTKIFIHHGHVDYCRDIGMVQYMKINKCYKLHNWTQVQIMVISSEAEKTSDKTQYYFMSEVLKKLWREGVYMYIK